MERKYGKGGKWLGVFFIIIVFVILVVVNVSQGPSPEDLKKFNDLRIESEKIEEMQKDIWEKEGEILLLQERLKKPIKTTREKRRVSAQLALLTEKTDSLKEIFLEKYEKYETERLKIPKELSDSLKTFK